ncbi:hypothetical protein BDR26DRAFT_918983 [Obelidium mucronatum]|nr:hypothetical protein BDR26DRAFT_918983 [Obelidium mucronatum]
MIFQAFAAPSKHLHLGSICLRDAPVFKNLSTSQAFQELGTYTVKAITKAFHALSKLAPAANHEIAIYCVKGKLSVLEGDLLEYTFWLLSMKLDQSLKFLDKSSRYSTFQSLVWVALVSTANAVKDVASPLRASFQKQKSKPGEPAATVTQPSTSYNLQPHVPSSDHMIAESDDDPDTTFVSLAKRKSSVSATFCLCPCCCH